MNRPTEDQTNLEHAAVASKRSTCIRRSVGCVLVDENGHILSTGRNGVPKGQPHCNEGFPCKGADAPSGTALTECKAIHAEVNALAHCTDPSRVHTIYVTVSPCKFCVDMLIALPNAKRIVAAAPYPNHSDSEERWKAMGREWEIQPIIAVHWIGIDMAREEERYYIRNEITGVYIRQGLDSCGNDTPTAHQHKAKSFPDEESALKFLGANSHPNWKVKKEKINGLG